MGHTYFHCYRLLMSVQLIPAEGWNPWFQNKTFLARPYPMMVMIKGSQSRIHLYKSNDLVMDASVSTDKSYRDDGKEAMKKNEIKWKCQPFSVQSPQPAPLIWTVRTPVCTSNPLKIFHRSQTKSSAICSKKTNTSLSARSQYTEEELHSSPSHAPTAKPSLWSNHRRPKSS